MQPSTQLCRLTKRYPRSIVAALALTATAACGPAEGGSETEEPIGTVSQGACQAQMDCMPANFPWNGRTIYYQFASHGGRSFTSTARQNIRDGIELWEPATAWFFRFEERSANGPTPYVVIQPSTTGSHYSPGAWPVSGTISLTNDSVNGTNVGRQYNLGIHGYSREKLIGLTKRLV